MWVASTFGPTPIMSTYLLAFTVNEFKYKPDEYDSKEILVCCCYHYIFLYEIIII